MQPIHQLWSILEQSPGLSNTLPEWQRRLGTHFDVVRPWFRPTDHRATSFEYSLPGGNTCLHRVVDHGDGEIIAVCNDEDRYCDKITLSPGDIIINKLDFRTLASVVAQVFNFPPEFAPVEGFYQTFLLGKIQPIGSRRFPIFLTIQRDKANMKDAAVCLLAKTDTPFVLLSPTGKSVDREMADLLAHHKSQFMLLEDILAWDEINRNLTGTEAAPALLSDFVRQAAPETTKLGPMDHFPTPPGASWEHFTFEFLADAVLLVRCKGVQQTRQLEPEHLGMKRQDNGEFTKQWLLLKILARYGGRLTWKDRGASQKVKDHKYSLSKKLREYFQLDEDPIPWKRKEHAFETRFILRQYQPQRGDNIQQEMDSLDE